ncbi:hypothetical protein HN011_009114, partial [Eciton burchellii]
NTWKKYVEDNTNRDPWSITYRIIANKLKTGNIMSTIKKADGSMIAGWQKTANEVIKSLFLKDYEALEGDRLPIEKEDSVELSEIREYIHTLKPNKSGPDGIKAEIYQKIYSADIIALFLTQIINDCFKKGYFLTQHKKAELFLIYKGGHKDPQDANNNKNFIPNNMAKKGKSTVDAISHIVDKIKTRDTTYVLGLFVDLSGAFDHMSWPRLFSLVRDLQIPLHVYNLL